MDLFEVFEEVCMWNQEMEGHWYWSKYVGIKCISHFFVKVVKKSAANNVKCLLGEAVVSK